MRLVRNLKQNPRKEKIRRPQKISLILKSSFKIWQGYVLLIEWL